MQKFVIESIFLLKHFLCANLVAMGRLCWHCKDNRGNTSGPWTSHQMYEWFAQNKLSAGYNIQVKVNALKDWHYVHELFPKEVEPFRCPWDALDRLALDKLVAPPPPCEQRCSADIMAPRDPPPVNWPSGLDYFHGCLAKNQKAWMALHGRM